MTVASQVKQTLAGLKGVQATLRLYIAQTQNKETEAVYQEALVTTGEIIADIEQRIKELEFQEPQY